MSAPGAGQWDTFKTPRSFLGEQMTTRPLDWSRKILLGCLVAGTCPGGFDTTPACSPASCLLPLPLSIAFLEPNSTERQHLQTAYFTVQLSDLQGLIAVLEKRSCQDAHPFS